MSDEPRTPEPDLPDPTSQHGTRDETGIIGLSATQAIPAPAPATEHSSSPAPPAARAGDEEPQQDWFDVFGAEHPTEGAGVPARADDPWGSDRADALAEEAHRAAYAPPTAPAVMSSTAPSPMSAVPAGAAAPGQSGLSGEPAHAPTLEAAPVSGGPTGPHGVGPAGGGAVASRTAVPRRRRGLLVALVAAACLASGLIGGVTAQLIDQRGAIGDSTLPQPGPGATVRPAGSIANIAATALPSVVTIMVNADGDSGTGSGFAIDAKGHILTNNHVIAAAVDSGDIEVLLSNGDTEKATIVGRDGSYDLAVLKLDRTDLTPLQLGPSDQVVVGDQVIAMGAPLGLEQTVTAGIVSALNRPVSPGTGDEATYMNAIQTDAAINPGNSGGPLLDMSGRVIGINSAIARVPGTTSAASGNIGLGFAIPSDQARRTAEQLIATGKSTHPVIGVLLDRTYGGEGAQVSDAANAVTAGGPADKAGIKSGDLIVEFEGKRIRTPDQLIVSIRARAVGETVTLKVERDGQEIDVKMTLEADPAD
jgi:putative serine protease PepD